MLGIEAERHQAAAVLDAIVEGEAHCEAYIRYRRYDETFLPFSFQRLNLTAQIWEHGDPSGDQGPPAAMLADVAAGAEIIEMRPDGSLEAPVKEKGGAKILQTKMCVLVVVCFRGVWGTLCLPLQTWLQAMERYTCASLSQTLREQTPRFQAEA